MEEDNSLDLLKEKKDKILNWLKKDYNVYFIGILILALAIRLYYFSLTLDQTVWWDEAEYMNMARAWAFNLEYKFIPVRPVLFSLITAFFFKITETEFLPRLLILIFSFATVVGMYYLGKEVYNKKVGLLASFFMAIIPISLFYSSRLLVGIPSLAFFIFASLFFYKYLKTKQNKMLYIGTIILAFGTLFRITTAVFLFAFLIYLLVTEKLKFLKRKELYISAIIFLLILSPYLIWGYIQFDGFVITQAGAWNAPEDNHFSNALCNIKGYLGMFPSIFSWPVLIFFLLGLFLMYELILGFDVLLKGGSPKLNKYLFLLLIFLIPLISISYSFGGCHQEDRYLMNSFPAVFIIASAAIFSTYKLLKKQNKKVLGILMIIILLGLVSHIQLPYAGNIIKSKINSYSAVQEAGKWLDKNSQTDEIIITSSYPQIKYYSKRNVFSFPPTQEKLESFLEENSKARYYIVSSFENSPGYIYNYSPGKNITVAQAYFADSSNTQPILIIYKLD